MDLLEEILDTVRQLRRDTPVTPSTGYAPLTPPPGDIATTVLWENFSKRLREASLEDVRKRVAEAIGPVSEDPEVQRDVVQAFIKELAKRKTSR